MNKPWYQSKTKWGAVLLAVGILAKPAAIAITTGDPSGLILSLPDALGALGITFGVRDLLGNIETKVRGGAE